jgi:hypothetical protein
MRSCREERLICAEMIRKWYVFVKLSGPDVQLYKEVCILDVDLFRSYADDGSNRKVSRTACMDGRVDGNRNNIHTCAIPVCGR